MWECYYAQGTGYLYNIATIATTKKQEQDMRSWMAANYIVEGRYRR